ncbi:MAG: M28 family peptidase [Pseudomonadales bacterium]|nr:M28 family peptidase [Pseudomonadales bacterium]
MRRSTRSFISKAFVVVALGVLAGCASTPVTCPSPDYSPVIASLTAADLALLDSVPRNNMARGERAASLLGSAACDSTSSTAIKSSNQFNYECVIAGMMPARIVIGAHYDKVWQGQGVIDNWTGIVVLQMLAHWFAAHPPVHTMVFVAFGEEEPGMIGSRDYVRQRGVDNVAAMVNIDTLGIGPLTIDSRSDEALACRAREAAAASGVETRSNALRESVSDWEPFDRRGVPILNFHSLDARSLRLLHSSRDRRSNLIDARLEEAARGILNAVIYLDRSAENIVER